MKYESKQSYKLIFNLPFVEKVFLGTSGRFPSLRFLPRKIRPSALAEHESYVMSFLQTSHNCPVCFKAVDRDLWSLHGTAVQSVGRLVVPPGRWLGKFSKICLVPECLSTRFPLSQKPPLCSPQRCFFTKAEFPLWSHSLSYFQKASRSSVLAKGGLEGTKPFTPFFVPLSSFFYFFFFSYPATSVRQDFW